MARTNNDLIAGLINEFHSSISMRKVAQESDVRDLPQGQEAKPVDPVAGQTDRGAEQQADLKNQPGAPAMADTAAAPNATGLEHPQEEVKQLDADQAAPEGNGNPTVTEVTVNDAPASDIAKVARAERLGSCILGYIGRMRAETIEKTAEQQLAGADPAVVQAFLDFNAGFQRGLEKKAQDVAEVVESGIAPNPEEAAAILDAVAAESPEAVLPEEAQPEAALAPEQAQMISELADAMVTEGVTPDDLAEAAQAVQELQDAGVSPEEIVQAAQEIGSEEQAAEQEKVAAERKALAKAKMAELLRRK